MKWRILIFLFVLASVFIAPSIALAAEPPQAYQFAMVKCSGLGTVENVVYANQAFDTWYGTTYNLRTDADWQSTYIARVNNFASVAGCPVMLVDDGTPTGQLSFWARIYAPWYQRFSPTYAALKANQLK